MELSINEAKIKRRTIKATATRLQNFLESPQSAHASKFELYERKKKLADLFEQYDEIQSRLELLDVNNEDPGVFAAHAEDRARFEESYYRLMALYEQRLSIFDQSIGVSQSTSNDHIRAVNHSNAESQIRLPKIQLPTFSGAYEDWYTFYDSFDKLIHTNDKLSSIQKFHYLRSSLIDEAANVIKSFDITASNYDEAWQLLVERFDNKRRIIKTHIKVMFDIAPIHKENSIALRGLIDEILKHFRALRALKRPVEHWDDIMIHLVTSKLDPVTVKEWELSRMGQTIPTFKDLMEFLSERCLALETITNKTHFRFDTLNSAHKSKNPAAHVSTAKQVCVHCKDNHHLFQCESFRKLPVDKRFEIVKESHLCLNCLKTREHQARNCTSSHCKRCGKLHNTLLHFNLIGANGSKAGNQSNDNNSQKPADIADTKVAPPVVSQCIQLNNGSNVFLSTAIIKVHDRNGEFHFCRALLDNGSQLNFITERMANRLQLDSNVVNMSICGVAEGTFESKKMVRIKFQSRINAYSSSLECIVLPRITQKLPQQFAPAEGFKIPSNIVLADPNFNIPDEIDLLIGAQTFWHLICVGQIRACKVHPILQKTKLGWIISGTNQVYSSNMVTASCHTVTTNELDISLTRFWEVEHNISSDDKRQYTPSEKECESHFQRNIRRNSEGRFVVKLPVDEEKIKQLGDSMGTAKRRFLSLEKRLSSQHDVCSQYRQFMREYADLNHMSEARNLSEDEMSYYMPHHAVFKESSTTTKLRVVFDASCKSASGVSLNDALLIGPTIQEDLFSILLRFRTFRYAMTADITKMYRQILIDESQRSLQRIFWRESPHDPLKIFELSTLTYGTASASFLAIRTVRKLAEDEADLFPIGSEIVLRDFYVDDLITGASTLQEALDIKEQTNALLSKGGFELRKWSSNHPSLRDAESPHSKELNLSGNRMNETKALGMSWNCEADIFRFDNLGPHPSLQRLTKRVVLSRIALIFDPLGWLGPSIVIAKILMQEIWRSKVDWDESLPNQLHTQWKHYESKLQILSKIEVPRKVIAFSDIRRIEVHGFSDASQQAYGACVYIRTTSNEGRIRSHLLCSKSRVAPLKTLSIPRLELCGALVLAQLVEKVLKSLPFTPDSTHYWTDSSIVLCWLRSCSRQWTPFVANRIAEIQRITSVKNWQHVPGLQNPADSLSRGVMPDLLHKLEMWWNGPPWLSLDEHEWPVGDSDVPDMELPELRSVTLITGIKADGILFEKFSKLHRLIRVIAFCLRFIHNCKIKKASRSYAGIIESVQPLSVSEVEEARLCLVKMVQRDAFQTDINSIKQHRCVSRNSKLLNLNPFIEHDVLRVGGRLRHANIPFDSKHPILLPGKHPFTKLIIISEHERHFHAGAQATLAAIRQCYWPTSARNAVRSIIRKCVVCIRNAPKLRFALMSDLPESRVNIVRYVFQYCGVDYAGPFFYKERHRKSAKVVKCYIALFVCLSTKAIHIELAADLSAETYLNVLKRFISRRGRPTEFYSDNGLNFVGAKHELNELYKLFKDESTRQRINDVMSTERIKWHFIPPRAPHMGGIWEAAIKSAKFHLKRITKDASLRYDELMILIVQIEAILNSRPLTPLSNDPNDLRVLTPGHFIIGSPITAYPESSLECLPTNRLSRWQRIEQLKQHFWRRWIREYLQCCQTRVKWKKAECSINRGDLVILKEENVPLLCWPLARVEEVFPGSDGTVRVVSVRTAKGIYKRPIIRLCVLPIEQ